MKAAPIGKRDRKKKNGRARYAHDSNRKSWQKKLQNRRGKKQIPKKEGKLKRGGMFHDVL